VQPDAAASSLTGHAAPRSAGSLCRVAGTTAFCPERDDRSDLGDAV